MPSWFFSQQFRLIVSFALVLTLALAGVSVYVGLAADREAERLQANTDEARTRRITHALGTLLLQQGWMGRPPARAGANRLCGGSGHRRAGR